MDPSQERMVYILTGTGLKDPNIALKSAGPFLELPVDLATIEQAPGWV